MKRYLSDPVNRRGARNKPGPDRNERRRFVAICAATLVGPFAAAQARSASAVAEGDKSANLGPAAGRSAPGTQASRGRGAQPSADSLTDDAIADNIAPGGAVPQGSRQTDVFLEPGENAVFHSVVARLARLRNYLGHGNFNLVGWDQALRIARRYPRVGAFSKAEIAFIEKLFYADAAALGFYGDKVVTELDSNISARDVVKIPGSGHYLFRGKAADTYDRIRADVGDTVILTSGIRSVVKQAALFLDKVARVQGNLSLASRSVAPPGYSYHVLGDFDVGKRGFGHGNFSESFTGTDEYRRLLDLGYLDFRYPRNNPFGVRYEPWHIRVT